MNETSRYLVTSITRRYAELADPNGTKVLGRIVGDELEPAIGDRVEVLVSGDEYHVVAVLPRRNELVRAHAKKRKTLAVNVDLLLIVTAPGALFNTQCIDRLATIAAAAGIPARLILNKTDLPNAYVEQQELLELYKGLGLEPLAISVSSGYQLSELELILEQFGNGIVAVAGVSGVGKSSLLKALIPGLELRTGSVSEKTGQGKQTTSLAIAHRYQTGYLVDLPGFQQCGVSHLTFEQIRGAMADLIPLAAQCRFASCMHVSEPDCAVRSALSNQAFASSRYSSYLSMIEEIRSIVRY